MLPVLQVGPLAIPVPALVTLVGLWLGLSLAEHFASRQGVRASHLYNLILLTILAGVIGARMSYVLRYPAAFRLSPLDIFSRSPELLDPWGGLAAGVLTAIVYGQRKRMPLWPTLDALVPFLALLQITAGVSHLASGSAFGAPTQVAWGIELWGARRHPSQVYEILSGVLILWAVWPGRENAFFQHPGQRFLSFVVLSAVAILVLEAFRGDSVLLPGGLRLAQVVAWVVLGLSLFGLGKIRPQRGTALNSDI